MKGIGVGLLLVFFLGFAGCSSQPSRPPQALVRTIPITGGTPVSRIAIVVQGTKTKGFAAEKAEAIVAESLVQKGYVVANMSDVYQVLKDSKVRDSAYFDQRANVQRLGRLLKIDAILLIKPTDVRQTKIQNRGTVTTQLSMNTKLIDAELASLRWIKNVEKGSSYDWRMIVGVDIDLTKETMEETMSYFPSVGAIGIR